LDKDFIKKYRFRMSDSNKNELLEPTGISSSSILNICGPKESVQKPKIGEFPKESDTLSRVKSFLPKLKLAENELKRKIDQGQNVDIEDIGENDSKHIEMNVEMFEQKQQWSEDSEPDSPPSPAERDNAFTSDSDSSSSDSVSSSSAASEKSLNLKLPNQDKSSDSKKVSERPVIEELN